MNCDISGGSKIIRVIYIIWIKNLWLLFRAEEPAVINKIPAKVKSLIYQDMDSSRQVCKSAVIIIIEIKSGKYLLDINTQKHKFKLLA